MDRESTVAWLTAGGGDGAAVAAALTLEARTLPELWSALSGGHHRLP